MEWIERDGQRWLSAQLPEARAAFTTRLGGVSEAEFESLNLGVLTADAAEAVRENRRRAGVALGRDPDGVLIGFQEHRTEVARRESAPRPNGWLEAHAPAPADGQATSSEGLTPLVLVADCLPVALAGRRGVAMLHCGWRGLAGGIVARGVAEVGASAAVVGPGIGPCCFEVGPEVLARFEHLGDGLADGRMLDLREIARRSLAEAGVDEVEVSDLCTSCERELFFSHRRDRGRTGRQAGLVWIDVRRSEAEPSRAAVEAPHA
jgi:YfiH family protein